MTRSKLSTKVILLATGIGLSMAAFAGSQPAAAQSFLDEYECPIGVRLRSDLRLYRGGRRLSAL